MSIALLYERQRLSTFLLSLAQLPGLQHPTPAELVPKVVAAADAAMRAASGALARADRPESIAHELLHATNVEHHGDGDDKQITWQWKQVGGKYVLTENNRTITLGYSTNGNCTAGSTVDAAHVQVIGFG